MTNWEVVSNNWQQAGSRIRVTWGKLSDADIVAINGDRERLASILQDQYRFGKNKVEEMIVNFTERLATSIENRLEGTSAIDLYTEEHHVASKNCT